MARIETDPNYTSPTFPRATAPSDPFKKDDVQALAAAVSGHTHTTGKGLPLPAGSVTAAQMAAGAASANVGPLGGWLTGTLPNPALAANSVSANELVNGSVTRAKLASDARVRILGNTTNTITYSASGTGSWVVTPLNVTAVVDPTGGLLLVFLYLAGIFNTSSGAAVHFGFGLDGAIQLGAGYHVGTGTPLVVPAASVWYHGNPGGIPGSHVFSAFMLGSGGTVGISNQANSSITVVQVTGP